MLPGAPYASQVQVQEGEVLRVPVCGHISKACRSVSKRGRKQKSHKTHHVSIDSEPDDMDSVADDLNAHLLYALPKMYMA